MGKNESCEPATKKLKQSQLCFKSPKNGNNLKSKINKDVPSENSGKDIKVHISEPKEVIGSHDISKICSPIHDNECNISIERDSLVELKDTNKNDETVLENSIICKTIKKNESDFYIEESNSKNQLSEPLSKNETTESNANTNTLKSPKPISDDDSLESDVQPSSNYKSELPCKVLSNDETDVPMEVDTSTSDNNIADNDDNLSPQTPKSKVDDSKENSMLTPKSGISMTSNSEDDSDNTTSTSSTPVTPNSQIKKLTPKMLKRQEESLKKKQLQRQLKEEKLALKMKMRDEKLKQKMEEEEKKQQLKEERKKKRLAELELKNEEKRQKQEDKRLKKEKDEEEKQRKKEQEQKKDNEKSKKERNQAAAFVSYFKKQTPTSSTCTNAQSSPISTSDKPAFMPFPMKNDMRLAAICRRQLEDYNKEKLDSILNGNDNIVTYLDALKGGSYTPCSASATWPAPSSEELHDCIIIEAQVDEASGERGQANTETNAQQTKTSYRAKLLQFCENRRPAYFGTWSKSSKQVSGRKPFTRDTEGVLDYEADSDSDWEEEEEGEDLENLKDDEAEGQEEEVEDGENGYLLDNTFVPHGYLSDEEQPEDEEEQESLEKQKDRLVALKEEFDEEMKQGGAQALKPRLLGCLWVSNSTTQVSKGSLYEVLLGHRAVWEESSGSIDVIGEPTPTESSPNSTQISSAKKLLPPFVMQEIARMVEGSRWPLNKLVREVGEVIALARPQNPVSRMALTRTIKHIASKTLDSKENSVWTIKPEFRAEYNLQEIEVNTPTDVTPDSRTKGKETLLETFLKNQQPSAKKRISLSPMSDRKENDEKPETPDTNSSKPEGAVSKKKKVAFVTLPPRTPTSNQSSTTSIPRTPGPWTSTDGQMTVKPHIDTPRPVFNRFINKDKQETSSDSVIINDDSI